MIKSKIAIAAYSIARLVWLFQMSKASPLAVFVWNTKSKRHQRQDGERLQLQSTYSGVDPN